jgi:hypothetical protein
MMKTYFEIREEQTASTKHDYQQRIASERRIRAARIAEARARIASIGKTFQPSHVDETVTSDVAHRRYEAATGL